MDPLSPAITFFDKDGKGRTSYIGSLVPDKLFSPIPGLWFTNQGSEVTRSNEQAKNLSLDNKSGVGATDGCIREESISSTKRTMRTR
jgi:hypothetical protein